MGFLDIFKKSNSKNSVTQLQSKYENLPLVNNEDDKKSANGYVERKFITQETLYEDCDNIFFESDIPIVSKCDKAIRYIETTVLQNINGSKVRSVNEIIYFPIPKLLQKEYISLIDPLNEIMKKHNISSNYFLKIDDIVFAVPKTGNYRIPVSHVKYDQDLNEFHFIFATEYELPPTCDEFVKYSSPVYSSIEIGHIIYDENGTIKKAQFNQGGMGKYKATIRFKKYKSGLELFDIRHDGNIIYKKKLANNI